MMEKKKIFKNKTQIIVYSFLFVFFILGFIYLASKDYGVANTNDSQKFVSEHKEVDKDNVYVYLNASDVYSYLKEDNVMLLMGNKNNSWVGYYANVLNAVAKEQGITKVYYYDFTEDRKVSNGIYEMIVEYLKDYVTHTDSGTANLYGPTFLIKKNGLITYFDDSTAVREGDVSAQNYWNSYQINIAKAKLTNVISQYLEGLEDGEE